MKKDISRLKKLAVILDDSILIPGTNYRIGIDALIGLVPGIGDIIGALMSSYIVMRAAALGISWPTLMRMLVNIALEGVVGSVPFIGDLIDAAYKANMRNLSLIEREVAAGKPLRSSKVVFIGIIVMLIAVLAGIIALVIFVLQGFFTWLGSF